MAPPSSKRRKISPTASQSVSVPGTPSRTIVPQDGARTTSQRPSFASPTKASLAKHNPQVLEKIAAVENEARNDARAAAEEQSQNAPGGSGMFATPAKEGQSGSAAAASQNIEPATQENVDQPAPSETLQPATGDRPTRSTRGSPSTARRGRASAKDSSTAAEASQISATGTSVEGTSAPIVETETARSAALRRAPDRSQGVEPIQTQEESQSQTQSGPQEAESSRPAESREQEEPDLPPTPTQRGLADPVVTTPPSGIHNTPSKRSKRRRGEKQKPSPLKPRPEPAAAPEPERPAKRRKEEITQRIVPIDANAEKRKKRDQLFLELEQLKNDVQLAEKESERLRQGHLSGQTKEEEPPNAKEILGLLIRSAAPPTQSTTPSTPKTIFQSIGSFLPFSKKPRPPSAPINTEPPPSHLPLPLDDPLPHLQLFTPLTYSSTITILPPTPPTDSSAAPPSTEILQSHNITIRHSSALFFSRLTMTVNTTSLSVANLTLNKLDPNAEPELGAWARDRASSNSVLGRDVSAICWAMGQWVEVAIKRAKFWCMVERELGTEEGRNRVVEEFAAAAAGARKKKGRRGAAAAENEDAEAAGDEGDATTAAATEKTKFTRTQLAPQMKRQHMSLDLDGIELRLEWRISFDWTGEAESCISAKAVVPESWRELDERNSLAKVPDAFKELVRSKGGPMGATRAVVALLLSK